MRSFSTFIAPTFLVPVFLLTLCTAMPLVAQTASPGSMTQPSFIPIPSSQGVQQSKASPTPEDKTGKPPSVSQLQDAHRDASEADKNSLLNASKGKQATSKPQAASTTSAAPRQSDAPHGKPLPQ